MSLKRLVRLIAERINSKAFQDADRVGVGLSLISRAAFYTSTVTRRARQLSITCHDAKAVSSG